MPRLCAATTGIWPMKASARSENTNTVTRQRPDDAILASHGDARP